MFEHRKFNEKLKEQTQDILSLHNSIYSPSNRVEIAIKLSFFNPQIWRGMLFPTAFSTKIVHGMCLYKRNCSFDMTEACFLKNSAGKHRQKSTFPLEKQTKKLHVNLEKKKKKRKGKKYIYLLHGTCCKNFFNYFFLSKVV